MNKKTEQKTTKNDIFMIKLTGDIDQFKKEFDFLKNFFGEKTDAKTLKKIVSLVYDNIRGIK